MPQNRKKAVARERNNDRKKVFPFSVAANKHDAAREEASEAKGARKDKTKANRAAKSTRRRGHPQNVEHNDAKREAQKQTNKKKEEEQHEAKRRNGLPR